MPGLALREVKMRVIEDWVAEVSRILAWIASNRVPFAEITLTVKGGKVTFIDYRGPFRSDK